MAITGASSIYPRLAQLFIDVGGRGIETQAFALLLCCLIGIFIFGLLNRSLSAAVKAGGLAGVIDHLGGAIGGLALAVFLCGACVSLAGSLGDDEVRAPPAPCASGEPRADTQENDGTFDLSPCRSVAQLRPS